MTGDQLEMFSRELDLHRYPVRVQGSYGRFQKAFYQHRLAGRFRYGRLERARRWSDPRWWQELGCSRRSADAWERHGLIRWEGDDLVVVHYDAAADHRADAFSRAQRARAMKRWHLAEAVERRDRVSDRDPDRDPDRVRGSKPAPTLKTADAEAMPARARVVPFPLRESDLGGSPESIDLPPSLPPLGGEVGGLDRLSPGARRVWEAYPVERVDLQWLQPFHQTWHRLQLEGHADQVVELLERFKRSAQWQNDRLINLPHNFLERKVKAGLRRRWVDGCACNYCRTNPPRAAKPERILNPPPLATSPKAFSGWTPEQIAEAKALRESRGSA